MRRSGISMTSINALFARTRSTRLTSRLAKGMSSNHSTHIGICCPCPRRDGVSATTLETS